MWKHHVNSDKNPRLRNEIKALRCYGTNLRGVFVVFPQNYTHDIDTSAYKRTSVIDSFNIIFTRNILNYTYSTKI